MMRAAQVRSAQAPNSARRNFLPGTVFPGVALSSRKPSSNALLWSSGFIDAQRFGNRKPRRPYCRKHTAQQSDGDGPKGAEHRQRGSDMQRIQQLRLRPRRDVERMPAEQQDCQCDAEASADKGKRQGLGQHRDHHRGGVESDGAQGGDESGLRRDRRVHRIECGEEGANRHDAADQQPDHGEDPGYGFRLCEIEAVFPLGLHGERSVALQSSREFAEGRSVFKLDGDALEAAAVIGRLQNVRIAENFGIARSPASRVEAADNDPDPVLDSQALAHLQSVELDGKRAAHDELMQTWAEHPSCHQMNFRPQCRRRGADPAQRGSAEAAAPERQAQLGQYLHRRERRAVGHLAHAWGLHDGQCGGAGKAAAAFKGCAL